MKIERIKNFIAPVIILLASFFSWRVLLQPGFFSMHDYQQVARLEQLHKSLLAGQFPVRWVADLGFGYGYPLFNFYPPFVYYLGEIFHLFGFGYIDSIKLVWFFALFLSGLSMYLLAKQFVGRIGAIVSALFYIYAPYHAVDGYVRGALAELFSFVWLPLILFASYKAAIMQKVSWSVLTGVFLGALMITHNLIFLPFFGFYTLWYFYFGLINRKSFTKLLVHYLFSTLIAFGLTAFFWLPSLAEKQYTLVDSLLIKSLASYKIHFVCPEQLWNSLWGFGGSTAGCIDGISFKLGKLHLVSALFSFLLLFVAHKRKNYPLFAVIIISYSLLLIAVILTTNYSQFIWDHVSLLWYLQFPWRLLEFAVLFASLLAGTLVLFFKKTVLKLIFGIFLVSLLLLGNIKLFTPQYFYNDATDKTLTSDEEIKWNVSATSFEYLPKEVATVMTGKNTVWVDIDKTRISSYKFKVLAGDFEVKNSEFLPHKFSLSGSSKGGALIRFSITNFPGWVAWDNGKQIPVDDLNKYKLITLELDPGTHNLVVDFGDTQVRKIGNILSLITLLSLLIILYGNTRSKK